MQTRLRISLLLSIIVLIVASCGKKQEAVDGKTHIKIVHFYVDQRDTWQHQVIEPFMQAHPNIVVDMEAVPFGLYTTKILSAAASGVQLGDIVVIDDWFSPDLFKRDYTIALDSLFDRDLKKDDFYTQFFTIWRKGNQPTGSLLAMPACGGMTALFYNKDLFDKAGVKYPDSTWTYTDLLAAARKLTDAKTKQWGFLIDDGMFTGIDTYIYSNGGKILTDDYSKGAMSEPQSMAVMQSYVDLVQKEHIAPPPDPSVGLSQRFLLGNCAMMLTCDVAKQELEHAKFRWDEALPPKGPAGMANRQNGQAFGITKTSQHPNEAWELVKWIVTLPTKKGINEIFNTSMPLYKPLANSPEYLDGNPKCNRRSMLAVGDGRVFTLITPGWQQWRDHGFLPNVQEMLAGRKSVADGCKAIDASIDEALAQAK